jgi:hypothetical protein
LNVHRSAEEVHREAKRHTETENEAMPKKKSNKRDKPFCKVDGCENLWYAANGYCNKHHLRIKKYGDPLYERKPGWLPGDPRNPSKRPGASERLGRYRKGVPLSEETRRKQGETLRKLLSNPEMREKWRRAAIGRPVSAEARKKISAKRSSLPRPLKGWIHKADAVFSKYIRLSYSDGRGNCRCFTCDAVKPIAEMDCGHFVSRQHKSTRWMEKNCHPQCRFCNRYNEGRKDVYAVRLIEKYGPNILLELQEEKNKIAHINPAELQELIKRYQEKTKEFQTENY